MTGVQTCALPIYTFTNASYSGNLGLCGFPLTKTCGNDEGQQPPPSPTIQEDDSGFANGFHWKVVLLGYGCGFMFGLGMGYLVFSRGAKIQEECSWKN